ncbi:MAG: DNA-3-methyladenine glycosylase [Pyrinomonadaceae bacterium]|nr:DNA-3-methyladenine glycosylase [Acidobacteriota bacterium]MBP7473766.1 DNA-3-methyladenine glycosylase [Pyrinomonadaceae bacterium]MBP9110654.1 DNA-3-methyladenine glycosylase [Pyrinomonadaceae bacterium]
MGRKLPRKFYLREDTVEIARDLLGKLLVVRDENGERVSGMIVETEAYLGETDRAAHSFGGRRTARNEITYALGGHVYVFFIYGMYYQLNVVCGRVDSPHVVLIRAIEPVEGIETIRKRRSVPRAVTTGAPRSVMPDKNLTSGPGKLCIAMSIDRSLNGGDLLGDAIWIEQYRSFSDDDIADGKRIGIDYASEDAEKPWRFWIKANGFISKGK